MNIRLMSYIPYNSVFIRVKFQKQRKGQLDNAQICRKVSARP